MLQRNGKVYTDIVLNCAKATLQAIIRGKADLESVINSYGWRGYNGLIDLGFKKHFRVHHSNDEFARGKSHINGIESYWSFAKRRLLQFHGVPHQNFYLHLKETEFRFKYRNEDSYSMLLEMIRKQPLILSRH